MKFLNLNILKLKDSLCLIPSLSARLRSARLGRLRSHRHHPSSLRPSSLGPSSLGLITLIGLTSLGSALSAATVDDLTFTLINEGTEYAVTDCADTATGTLTIPDSYEGKPVTEIGANAFYESELTAIELPAGLRTIGEEAFYRTSIESIDLPATLTRIDQNAFTFSNLKSISLPAGLTTVAPGVFGFCESLAGSVTIPSGITEIPVAFLYKTALTEVILHDAVTSIGATAFYDTHFESISLPSSLKTIGDGAFTFSNLKSISLPAGLTALGKQAFRGCRSLTGPVTIPAGITEILGYVFSDCDALTEVILHDGITSIGEHAFNNSGLQSIRLPENLSSIGASAFLNTHSLAEVWLEGAAPSLGADAFKDAGRDVTGGTRFYIQYEQQASYDNSASWSGFDLTILGDPNAPLIEAFVLSTSLDASNNRFSIHSHGEPSDASASVLVQHRSSLTEGDWTAVASADVTESRDTETGVVTRSLTLGPSAEGGFYRLHYTASQ